MIYDVVLKICLCTLVLFPLLYRQIESNADNINMSLRMLEVYTDPQVFSVTGELASDISSGKSEHGDARGGVLQDILSHLIKHGPVLSSVFLSST